MDGLGIAPELGIGAILLTQIGQIVRSSLHDRKNGNGIVIKELKKIRDEFRSLNENLQRMNMHNETAHTLVIEKLETIMYEVRDRGGDKT